ncbi:MAG: MoaD/ThiS family protein [Chloroflexota bacterium]
MTSSISTATVFLPAGLRERAGHQRSTQVSGTTVREIVQSLDRAHPGLGFNICHETGELRQYINIFVNGDECRHLQELDTHVPEGALVHIMTSVAGG